MKKFLFLFSLILVCSLSINLNAQEISYTNLRDGNGISLNMSVETYKINSLNYRGEEMHEIEISGIFIPNDEGMPNLPRISRFVAIPQGAKANISIVSMVTETVANVNVAPALRIQAIPEEPSMDYKKNTKAYSKNAFYPENPFEISEVTSLRGVDAVIVGITPFQYNPVTKELIVIRNIELNVEFIGGTRDYSDNKYRSPWFDPILKNALLNYDALEDVKYSGKSARDGEGCEYLIVIPNRADFMPYAEQIKDFRTKQGIYTRIMRLDEMGVSTNTQFKTYIHNAYNTWDIPPVAVLLMGDHNTNMAIGIPAETISHAYSGSCITDNQYADVSGDKLPEMVFGRMAAETEAQMAVLVSKFLEYELSPCMEASYYQNPITALGWQTERWFQICSEVVGGYWRSQGKTPVRVNAIYSGTPGSVWSSNQNTNQVVSYFGPSGLGYLPQAPTELGGWSGGQPSQIVNAINNGAFALQHRDHGFEDGWGEPAFRSSHINQLTNVGKMTYLFTINCLTGKFNNNTPVFGELFHRYTYQGQNAGVVGFLGPTEVSYSFVNDAFAWGMYDLFDPQFMPTYGPFAENSGNWLPAFGNVAGKYFLAQSSWPYNGGDKIITYQMFTAHSDIFLRLYTEVPQTLAVTHADVTLAGNTNFLISATQGASIALTANGEILAVATGTGSQQTIVIPGTLVPTTEITVVCTKQNYLRYEAIVTVVPAQGPYVIGNNWVVNDASGDGILKYGETALIDMTAKNVGIETAQNVVMTISSTNEHITITQGSANFGNITPDGTASVANAFGITISQDAPNNYNIPIDISSTNGTNTWQSAMSVRAFRPIMEYKNFTWQGHFEAGQTLVLGITFENRGGAPVNNVAGVLSTTNPHVTINNPEQQYGTILQDGIGMSMFTVTLSDAIDTNSEITFNISAAGDGGIITAAGTFKIANKCNVIFNLSDSYGDGWNGASLRATFDDGTPQVSYTIPSGGSNAVYSKEINIGTQVTVTFVGGNYNAECSFNIKYESGGLIYQSSGTPVAGVVKTFVCDCGYDLPLPCDPVENLDADVDNNVVTLTWTADANSYIIKRDGTQIATVTNELYVDNDAPNGIVEYSVTAICESSSISDENIISVVIEAECLSVNNLSAVAENEIVNISWESDAPNFIIERDGVVLATISENSYVDSDAPYGTVEYTVTAVCGVGLTSDESSVSVEVEEQCSPISELISVITDNSVQLNWTEPNNITIHATSYNVYRNDVLLANITTTNYGDLTLTNGEHVYCIEAMFNNDCVSERICSNIVLIELCLSPIGLTATAENNTVILNWNSIDDTPLTYNVYRNANLLAGNIEGTTYVDINPIEGDVVYGVSATYDYDCEESEQITSNMNYTGIEGFANDIKIYPNPANSVINIEGIEMSKVLLYNNIGQLMLKIDVSGNSTSIDVSNFNSGIYVIEIIGKDNQSAKTKVVISK